MSKLRLVVFLTLLPLFSFTAGKEYLTTPFLLNFRPASVLMNRRQVLGFKSELYKVGTLFHGYDLFASKSFNQKIAVSFRFQGLEVDKVQAADMQAMLGTALRLAQRRRALENIIAFELAYLSADLGKGKAPGLALRGEYYLRIARKISFILGGENIPACRFWQTETEVLKPVLTFENFFHFHFSNIFGYKISYPELFIETAVKQRLWKGFYLNGGLFYRDKYIGGNMGFSLMIRNFYFNFNTRLQAGFVPVFEFGGGIDF